jgi:hypothetical protein
VKGPQAWILGAALGCFAAGMTVGLVAPGIIDAIAGTAAPDPDVLYVRKLAADFDLSASQERSLGMVVQYKRKAEDELLRNAQPDQLPDPLKNKIMIVRREATERIRRVLTKEQRERFDRQARAEAAEAQAEPGKK